MILPQPPGKHTSFIAHHPWRSRRTPTGGGHCQGETSSTEDRAELQKGILVSRIPDIFGRKSGHFKKKLLLILAYAALKGLNFVYLRHRSTPNE